jgi:diguanylate cyclase (GGDEF)-like protein
VEKTFHLELARTLEEEVKALDNLTRAESFSQIADLRLPRLKDFLPFQYIESLGLNQLSLLGRQYDEKFHMLQAPGLFLPDLAYFRAKCEERETSLAIGFVDIDDFKSLNSRHTETKVDRNLLPRFMQAIEAHVFHHGYAYRQGGEEYLLLLPSLSRALSIAFLEELRVKLAHLSYPDIPDKTTVSIGLCIVEPDSPLTDRELLDRANRAKQHAKEKGKNCIATYRGSRFIANLHGDLAIKRIAALPHVAESSRVKFLRECHSHGSSRFSPKRIRTLYLGRRLPTHALYVAREEFLRQFAGRETARVETRHPSFVSARAAP